MIFAILFLINFSVFPSNFSDLNILEKKVSTYRKNIKNLKNSIVEQKKALLALEHKLFSDQDKIYKNSFYIKDNLKFITPFVLKSNFEKLISFKSMDEKIYTDAIAYKFIKDKFFENETLIVELSNTKELKNILKTQEKFLSEKVLSLEKKEEKLKKLLKEKARKLKSIKESKVLKTKFIKRENKSKNYIKNQTKTTSVKSNFNINDFLKPVDSNKIAGKFGKYWDTITRNWSYRNGVLIKTEYGEEVYASSDGLISFIGWVDGFGNVLIIKHDNNTFSIYGHLLDTNHEIGQKVKKKDIIGHSGDSGSILEPMLYFEIKHLKKSIDPSVLF